MLLRMEAVVDLYVLMILGRGANGDVRIKSEPTLIAAAQQMGSILVIQHALPVGKLVQIESAAEVGGPVAAEPKLRFSWPPCCNKLISLS